MALEFVLELNLGHGNKPVLVHEPNADLWQYRINKTRLNNLRAQPYGGLYDDLEFTPKPSLITAKQIRDIGMKNAPGFGAYGFFTLLHRDTSYVLCPIHNNETTGVVPEVTITALDNNEFLFNITSKDEYECYRIELIKDYFTEERIVYSTEGNAEVIIAPELAGELMVAVTGYSEEIAIASDPWEGFITSTGTAPFVPTTGVDTMLLTLTVDGWSAKEQTLSAPGIKHSSVVFISPIPDHQAAYVMFGILCTAQGTDTLSFTCETMPSVAIDVQVVVL